MPRYMFDTNICIYLMKHHSEQVARRFAQCHVGDVIISSITFAELQFGATMCANPARERENLAALIELIEVAPFGANAAKAYGVIEPRPRQSNKGALDKLIAAHAVSLDVPVVTNNVRDFEQYPGLKVENWLLGDA